MHDLLRCDRATCWLRLAADRQTDRLAASELAFRSRSVLPPRYDIDLSASQLQLKPTKHTEQQQLQLLSMSIQCARGYHPLKWKISLSIRDDTFPRQNKFFTRCRVETPPLYNSTVFDNILLHRE